jgi:glycosyltransferase involved in cell wall biosynthesis
VSSRTVSRSEPDAETRTGAPGTVSVVIPAHRGGPFVREAVGSLLDQTAPAAEIIVVSDGCADDLSDLEAMDPRVRVLRQENAGVSVARNVGVGASTGEFVAFLDEDDRSHPERLQQQVDALGSVPGAALCFGKFQYIDAEGTVISPPLGEAVNQRDILELNFPMLSTLMVRRSSVAEAGGFDPALRTCEDIDFYLRVFMRHGATFVAHVVSDYRRHADNCKLGTWDLNPVFEKHRRWAESSGRTDLVAAADVGLRRVRRRASRAAFETSRAARHRGDLAGTARWLAICVGREPTFVPGVIWSKIVRRPDLSPEGVIPD